MFMDTVLFSNVLPPKTESPHDVNFVDTSGTIVCQNDNFQYHQ